MLMRMPGTLRVTLPLLLGWSPGLAEIPSQGLQASKLPAIESSAKVGGPQFLGADKKGNIFHLQAVSLEVRPLLPTGNWGPPTKLAKAKLSPELPILGAAVNRHGDTWVVHEGFGVRVFSGGKEKTGIPPPPWAIAHVALLEDQPVVTVIPVYVGTAGKIRSDDSRPDPASAPLAMVWNGKEWAPLLDAEEKSLDGLNPGQIREERTRCLYVGPTRTLWLASEYAHRFEERSASGRLLTEVEVGDGKVRQRADAAALQEEVSRLTVETEGEARAGSQTRIQGYASTAMRTATALTEGRDGRMYFFLEGSEKGGGYRLERYDPATQALETTKVTFETALSSIGSLAAGKDGLYLAAYQPNEGVFRISWEDLESAVWKPVPSARVNGAGAREEQAPRGNRRPKR